MKSLADRIVTAPWFYPVCLLICIGQGAWCVLFALNLIAALFIGDTVAAFYSVLFLGVGVILIWNFWRVSRPDNELLKIPERSK